MPWFFVQQPNGLLARYSTIVDGFTHTNLTDEDALEVAVQNHGPNVLAEHAQKRIDTARAEGMSAVSADGEPRWEKSIRHTAIVRGLTGPEGVEGMIEDLGDMWGEREESFIADLRKKEEEDGQID